MNSANIYERNLKLLKKLIPELWSLKTGETLKSYSKGGMELNLKVLHAEFNHTVIALSQYSHEVGGHQISNPGMEIKLYSYERIAEALTYRDGSTDYQVYAEKDKCYTKLKQQLNDFLYQWLTNCLQQSHELKRNNPNHDGQKNEIEETCQFEEQDEIYEMEIEQINEMSRWLGDGYPEHQWVSCDKCGNLEEASDMIYHFDQTLCEGCGHHYRLD